MKESFKGWALSHEFKDGRRLLGTLDWGWNEQCFCWPVRTFRTREQAQDAKLDCDLKPIRVERVQITVETI